MSTTYSNVKRKITTILTIFSIMVLCVALIPLRVHASTATLTLSDNTGTPATAANGTFTAYKVIDDRSITTDFADFFNNNATYGSYKFNGNEILNSAATIITGVQTDVTNSTEAAKLAVQLERYAAAKNLTGITFANNQAELSKGMWVVVETTSNGQTWTDNDGYQHTRIASRPMLVNMGDTAKTITLKDSSTSLRKTINDNNVPVKTNDVAIGGTVNYNVESAIPMYEYNAQTRLAANALLFQIDDIFSAGLDYQFTTGQPASGVTVTVGGVAVAASKYTVAFDENTRKLSIKFNNDWIIENQGQNVKVSYSVKLNSDAVANDTTGNTNTATLTFTQNPNTPNDTATLSDSTKTFTYKFKIHKVDRYNSTADMTGVEFTLYTDENCTDVLKLNGVDAKLTVGTGNMSNVLAGLDEGTYYMKETVLKSASYSDIGVVKVIVTAEKTAGNQPTGKATIAMQSAPTGSDIEEGSTVSTTNTYGLVLKVANTKGLNIPEAGAFSAILIMLAGALLVVGGLYIMGKGNKGEQK